MNTNIIEKRKVLQTLSHAAQELAETEGLAPENYKVNDLLMMLIYNPDDEFKFNSFQGWRREGYTIKKGSKAYLLWGQPINRDKGDKDKPKTNKEDEKNEPPFFPLAFLFRSDQVLKPIKLPKKEKKPQKVEASTPVLELDL